MVDWLRLLAQTMLPNPGLSQGLGPGLAPTQEEYQSPRYNPQPRSFVPLSSSNPFLNNRMMLMMMLDKMRATKVSLNQLNASKLFPVDDCWGNFKSCFVAVSPKFWFWLGLHPSLITFLARPGRSWSSWRTPRNNRKYDHNHECNDRVRFFNEW